ncbi:MAG: COR domain-containing protein [Chloroflexota bacterium]
MLPSNLYSIGLDSNQLTELPISLAQLKHLEILEIDGNPLNPELAAVQKEGIDAVKAYLRAKADAQIILNEAKLILVGEGEVGKTCLMDALEGVDWQKHPTTHGIEIRPISAVDLNSGAEIILNGWDFGGQHVYRPTHQLFFSSPAVYLIVWKPREGPQQGFVKEWIQLVKHREPDAKILVVATHGGPDQRQPDIDRQELWDLFSRDTVLDFFHVDSKPDENSQRRGIDELKQAIAHIAAGLPEMGREVPKSFDDARQALSDTNAAYLQLEEVYDICRQNGMDAEVSQLFVTISHRLGHLIHYEHDPALRDIVILKPSWLAAAISFVLDDEETRNAQGLVPFYRLSQLWNNSSRKAEDRYPVELHPLFLRLMERFDLSYKVALPDEASDAIGFWQQVKGLLKKTIGQKETLANIRYTSLIGQLVPNVRPQERLVDVWPSSVATGDIQQTQICKIVDDKGQSAPAEGLFYQLIVRLHRYSLGRTHYHDSVHWQRGLVLDHDYNGRALLEHIGHDIRITVRAPYPEGFLTMLTSEVKYLVESFWEGLRCDVMVPCMTPCGKEQPGIGLFEVEKLIAFRRQGMTIFPCMVSGCNQIQQIDALLSNAPAVRPLPVNELIANRDILEEVRGVRRLLQAHDEHTTQQFSNLHVSIRETMSKIDATYVNFIRALDDEAKEGPRLFSFVPVDRTNFNPREWTSSKFRLTLWCEHSLRPLPELNGEDSTKGVIELELTRNWFKKSAPFLKVMVGTLSLVSPIVTSGIKLEMDDASFAAIEEQLDLNTEIIDASISGGEQIGNWLNADDDTSLAHGERTHAHGATLRELHALLKEKDPGFGGLVRVRNKRQEFLWVHPDFEGEY